MSRLVLVSLGGLHKVGSSLRVVVVVGVVVVIAWSFSDVRGRQVTAAATKQSAACLVGESSSTGSSSIDRKISISKVSKARHGASVAGGREANGGILW